MKHITSTSIKMVCTGATLARNVNAYNINAVAISDRQSLFRDKDRESI